MLIYRYLCMKCSPAPDRLPADAAVFRVWGSRPYMAVAGGTVYGTVDFPRRLLPAEMLRYGLFPDGTVQETIYQQEVG